MIAGVAQASVILTVNSRINSISGGVPADSDITLVEGQHFLITVDPAQMWNFNGGVPGYTVNADGMKDPAWDFAFKNPDSSTFHTTLGTLVGQIGTGTADAGNFFIIGTHFEGAANASGKLNLFFWDNDAANNTGAVNALIDVPEPVSIALIGLGLAGLAYSRRRT